MLWRNGALVALALVPIGPALAHFEVVEPMVGFSMYALGGVLGALAVTGGLFSWARSKEGGRAAVLLGALPAAGLLVPMGMALSAGHPRINDIATDLEDPPALDAPYPAEFVPVVREHYPGIASLRLKGDAATVRSTAKFVAMSRDGWEVTELDDGTLRGTDTTELFRFKDDFAIRVRADKGGSILDMRSRSRDGKGDFGVNAERIRRFLADVAQAVGR